MYELIEKYLKGKCKPDEEAHLLDLFREYGYSLEEEDISRLLNEVPSSYYPDENTSYKMKQFILNRISVPVKKTHWTWLSAAACILIAGSFLLYQQRLQKLQSSNIEWVSQSNHGRGVTRIMMPDSTLIWLNTSSSVQYPKDYAQRRTIRLTGEAFFQVKHNINRPFSVQTEQLKVVVLGTSFNIKDYAGERHIEVKVSTGKVSAALKGKDGRFLLPGEVYSYDHSTGRVTIKPTTIKDIDAWTKGEFVFKDRDLEEITNMLSRRFDIRFSFQTEGLKERKVTLRLKNESLGTIMKVLQVSANIRYQQSNHQIELSDAQ